MTESVQNSSEFLSDLWMHAKQIDVQVKQLRIRMDKATTLEAMDHFLSSFPVHCNRIEFEASKMMSHVDDAEEGIENGTLPLW